MLLLSALPVADTMLRCEKEVLPGPRACNHNTHSFAQEWQHNLVYESGLI